MKALLVETASRSYEINNLPYPAIPLSFWRSSPGIASRNAAAAMADSKAVLSLAATKAATADFVSVVILYYLSTNNQYQR